MTDKAKPTYCHDYAHCGKKECPLYEKCYRGFLDREIKNTGYEYATYFEPKEVGDKCEYFMEIEGWRANP